ncbi:putative uncharacterized protein [Firmicutes bacterium CAG:822]|nr:putative uncharacterized protein [Firmicutes bacterium CAG:822]
MKEKYLPIGTVVTLKDATKKIMIIGYCPVENGKNQMYDYSACLYPEGVIDSNKVLLCNHDQIAQIHFVGFESEEQKQNNENLKSLVNNMNNLKNIKFPENTQQNSTENIDTLNIN